MIEFPDPECANADGLLASGGDLEPETLISAYHKGIFPWYEVGGPILWWSPDPRMVLFPDKFHCSRRLARRMRQQCFRISENEAFAKVMLSCADRDGGNFFICLNMWPPCKNNEHQSRVLQLAHVLA